MLLQIFSRLILWICGWRSAELDSLKNLKTDVVLAIQHTSYWDYVIGVLYAWAYGLGSRCRFIMAGKVAQRFRFASCIFKYTGCIYVPDCDKRSQGALQHIVERLKSDPQPAKIIFIAPNGSTKGGEWRSGWYYIAKLMNAKVGVVGVHFHPLRRTIKLSDCFIDPKVVSHGEADRLAKVWMSSVFPKFPQFSTVPVEEKTVRRLPITNTHTLAVDPVTASAALLFIPVVICWIYGLEDLAVGGGLTAFCSVMYHRSHEQSNFWSIADSASAKSTLTWFWIRAVLNHCLSDLVGFVALFLGVVFFYLLGTGRHKHPLRTKRYVFCHTIWHLVMVVFIVSYCLLLSEQTCMTQSGVHIHYIVGNFRDEL
jgi:hypothetical protein